MCGIGGLVDLQKRLVADELEAVGRRLSGALAHRGPDGDGVLVDAPHGICLTHRRLSIIDLSEAGSQPMTSPDGRFTVVFNGEIFNFKELRAVLAGAGHRFAGSSDTEVMVHAFSRWGVEATLGRLIGMFAVAVWDRERRVVQLFRDRMGVKPLYWSRQGSLLWFGSELVAMRGIPGLAIAPEPEAAGLMLERGYVPGPRTILKGVHKLQGGHLLTVALDTGAAELTRYWSLDEVAVGQREARRAPRDESEALQSLEALLTDSVGRRMVSDVPLGAFLSGGIDSSLVVALMQRLSPRPVQTFTIGFSDRDMDEAPFARRIAAHLGTDHHELMISDPQVIDLARASMGLADEPLADYSLIPTALLCRHARQHVTVALSGDGGDELFAGYSSYRWTCRAVGYFQGRPWSAPMRTAARTLPAPLLRAAARLTGSPELAAKLSGERLERLRRIGGAHEPGQVARALTAYWQHRGAVMVGVPDADEPHCPQPREAFDTLTEWLQFADTGHYLPDDILTKVDRASMAVGLEVRVPLLDHRVVEFAWSLPDAFKVRGGVQKWALRQILARHVPRDLFERPKMGFTPPLAAWLRGPLRDWAEQKLAEPRLAAFGFLNVPEIRRRWAWHQAGAGNWERQIWAVLTLVGWYDRFIHGEA